MGGSWSACFTPDADPVAVRALIQAALDRVEGQMSAWRPDSALSRFNTTPVGQWVDLPTEMAAVVGAGLGLMAEMPGIFSILLGGASARFGFLPGEDRSISADPDAIELNGHRVRRHVDVALDLNAIAKGYAADLAAESLYAAGYRNFLIEAAGDIRTRGTRPDSTPWSVALELPIPDRIIPARQFPLVDAAIATSGGYRRSRGADSHLISPKANAPISAGCASVAVVADTAMQADGWATVMALLGPQAGLVQAEKRGLAVTFIEADPPEGFIERGSSSMEELIAGVR